MPYIESVTSQNVSHSEAKNYTLDSSWFKKTKNIVVQWPKLSSGDKRHLSCSWNWGYCVGMSLILLSICLAHK